MNSKERMIKATEPITAYLLRIYTAVYKEIACYGDELDIISQTVDEIIRECFFETAEGIGLSVYEELVGAKREDLTLEQRRKMLTNLVTLNENDNTLSGIEKFFNSVGLECEITENPHICDLYILAKGRTYTSTEKSYITERAKEFLPCHLTFTIDFRTTGWAEFDAESITFAELDGRNLSWRGIES